MTDPITTGTGFKAVTLIFAALGAGIGLANSPPVGRTKAVIALATGFATAVACGPMVQHYAGAPDSLSFGVAFVLAACAQRAVPPLLDWVGRVMSDPMSVFRKGE
jgi:hypothetical protein